MTHSLPFGSLLSFGVPDSPPPARPVLGSETSAAPAVQASPAALSEAPSGRPHLVVVTTRVPDPADAAQPGAVLVTRFWHPRDRRWSENFFESIDHAFRLFVDETGWTLLQQQTLAGPHEHELIFQAHREDFSGPSTEEILEEVGLTPKDVADLLDRGK